MELINIKKSKNQKLKIKKSKIKNQKPKIKNQKIKNLKLHFSTKRYTVDLHDFPDEYLTCIADNNWRKRLKELETMILSYCAALNQLQRHNSQLHDVLHCFGNLVTVLRSLSNVSLKNKLLKKLEKDGIIGNSPFYY